MYFCVLCVVCFVTFPVLFVCTCVLNNCHRVATQLQLNIYHIISFCNSTFIHSFYISLTLRHKVTPPHNRRILLNAEPTTATLVVQHFMSSALHRAVSVPVRRKPSVATQNCRHERVCKLRQPAPRSARHPVRTKVLNWRSIPTNNWSLHPSYAGSGVFFL